MTFEKRGNVIALPHRQIHFSRDALSQQIERRGMSLARCEAQIAR